MQRNIAFAQIRSKSNQSSTSAVEYKLSHRHLRPPPLPTIDPPSWSAEEAVTNILYNTPASSHQPHTRHILNCLVQNEPGVLSRISGILAGRGFNIDSLVVCATEVQDLSRMTIVLRGQDGVVEQARRQLEDLVPVWAVLDYTHTKIVERELLLVKVSLLGPEHFLGQIVQRHEQVEDEFVHDQETLEEEHDDVHDVASPSDVLMLKHQNLQALSALSREFKGKLADISSESCTVELCAKPSRLDAFIKLVRPFGILESSRSGMMVLPRTPITSSWTGVGEESVDEEERVVDATMLPPG